LNDSYTKAPLVPVSVLNQFRESVDYADRFWPGNANISAIRTWITSAEEDLTRSSKLATLGEKLKNCVNAENQPVSASAHVLGGENASEYPSGAALGEECTRQLVSIGTFITATLALTPTLFDSVVLATRTLAFIGTLLGSEVGEPLSLFGVCFSEAELLRGARDAYVGARRLDSDVLADDPQYKLAKSLSGQLLQYEQAFLSRGTTQLTVHHSFELLGNEVAELAQQVKVAALATAERAWDDRVEWPRTLYAKTCCHASVRSGLLF
jgi:hypothetical protein